MWSSLVLVEEDVCYDHACVLLAKTLPRELALALLHFVLQGQTCLLLQVIPWLLLLHSSLLWWKGQVFSVSSRRWYRHRTIQLQLLWHYWLGHRLELLWHRMVCLGNKDHSVVFEIAPKYYISDSSLKWPSNGMNGIPLLKKHMFSVGNSCRFGSEVTGASFPR